MALSRQLFCKSVPLSSFLVLELNLIKKHFKIIKKSAIDNYGIKNTLICNIFFKKYALKCHEKVL
jgi:hypothetical protein